MAELTSLLNIGKNMEKRLKLAGISTAEELRAAGSKEAFVRLKMQDPTVCVVYLYTLEGAISGVEYNRLPEDVKQSLRDFSSEL